MPTLVIDLVTVATFFVGFTAGYYYRAWRERADAVEELRRLGIERQMRRWLRETDHRAR